MEWILVAAALVAVVLVRHFAARRVARGDPRFAWLLFAPTLLVAFAMLWVSVTLLTVQPVLGLFVGVVSVIGAILLVRMVRAMASPSESEAKLGDVSGPAFDYIVWGAIGAPFILVVALIVLLITGGLGDTR